MTSLRVALDEIAILNVDLETRNEIVDSQLTVPHLFCQMKAMVSRVIEFFNFVLFIGHVYASSLTFTALSFFQTHAEEVSDLPCVMRNFHFTSLS